MPSLSDITRYAFGGALPRFEATSPNLAALNSMSIESGLIDEMTQQLIPGTPLGHYKNGGIGKPFLFDPFELYRQEILRSLNIAIVGKVGMQKSGLVKIYVHRSWIVGYNSLIIDPKGEYDPLAEMIPGSRTVDFKQESGYSFNPLDPDLTLEEMIEFVKSLVLSVREDLQGSDKDIASLNQEESEILEEAITEVVNQKYADARLSDVLQLVFRPSKSMADKLRANQEYLQKEGRNLALALRPLAEGKMANIFNRETSGRMFDPVPLLVMKIKGLTPLQQALMVNAFSFYATGTRPHTDPRDRFHNIILDEAWDVTELKKMVMVIRRLGKFGGTQGQAFIWVTHNFDNLYHSGGHEAVKDLAPDTGTVVSFQLDQEVLERTGTAMRFNQAARARCPDLEPGESIWVVGNQLPFEVKQNRWPEETEMVKTRNLVENQTERRLKIVS